MRSGGWEVYPARDAAESSSGGAVPVRAVRRGGSRDAEGMGREEEWFRDRSGGVVGGGVGWGSRMNSRRLDVGGVEVLLGRGEVGG